MLSWSAPLASWLSRYSHGALESAVDLRFWLVSDLRVCGGRPNLFWHVINLKLAWLRWLYWLGSCVESPVAVNWIVSGAGRWMVKKRAKVKQLLGSRYRTVPYFWKLPWVEWSLNHRRDDYHKVGGIHIYIYICACAYRNRTLWQWWGDWCCNEGAKAWGGHQQDWYTGWWAKWCWWTLRCPGCPWCHRMLC